jgi:hypothetical protein
MVLVGQKIKPPAKATGEIHGLRTMALRGGGSGALRVRLSSWSLISGRGHAIMIFLQRRYYDMLARPESLICADGH